MGKPSAIHLAEPAAESIGSGGERGKVKHLSTRRQKKSIEIALVAASERATAQTLMA